jgi:hypothetical protein
MTLDYHPLIARTVASLKPNTAEARCMTTREGSRASQVRREGRRADLCDYRPLIPNSWRKSTPAPSSAALQAGYPKNDVAAVRAGDVARDGEPRPGAANMAFTPGEFRKALGVFPTGVAVVTARAPFDHSMTSSARASSIREISRSSGSLQVDCQLELGRLHEWKIGRLLPLQNAADIRSGAGPPPVTAFAMPVFLWRARAWCPDFAPSPRVARPPHA